MKKIRRYLQEMRYLIPTMYFNFHYLPFRQAVHLPIVLYKPHLLKCKGKVRLEPEDGHIRHGMIRLGFRMVSVYPNSGVTWQNTGGTVVFQGRTAIGNDAYLSIGPTASLTFGYDFLSTAGLKIICYRSITFHRYVRVGWGSLCMDTNFHPLFDMVKQEYQPASGSIEIGDYNWFGTGCKIMHGVTTPERCIFGMGTTVTRGCVKKSYCIMGGSPVRVLRENVMRVIGHDREEY